jgi:hypothetical protein
MSAVKKKEVGGRHCWLWCISRPDPQAEARPSSSSLPLIYLAFDPDYKNTQQISTI